MAPLGLLCRCLPRWRGPPLPSPLPLHWTVMIDRPHFKFSRRGYEPEEVDSFIESQNRTLQAAKKDAAERSVELTKLNAALTDLRGQLGQQSRVMADLKKNSSPRRPRRSPTSVSASPRSCRSPTRRPARCAAAPPSRPTRSASAPTVPPPSSRRRPRRTPSRPAP